MSYSATLQAVGGAHTGIAPVNLLDVEDTNGNLHYWADRAIDVPVVLTGEVDATTDVEVSVPAGQSVAWSFPSEASASYSGDGTTATVSYGSTMSKTGACSAVCSIKSYGGTRYTKVIWGGFSTVNIPNGAVIQKIEYVMMLKFEGTGTGSEGLGIRECSVVIPSGIFDLQQCVANAPVPLGNQWLQDIPALTAYIELSADINEEKDSSFSCTFCALAVYYTNSSTTATISHPGTPASGSGPYIPWLLSVPQFTFNRSLTTDTGEFIVQNLSGDTLSRDVEKIVRRSTFEGAMFVYRCWQTDAEEAWLEVHGTLSVEDIGPDTAKLKAGPLINAASTDCPPENYCETCQLDWGSKRCGATGTTECSYSFYTCQVPRRFKGVLNHYEKNYGEAFANTALNVINRRRRI